MSLAEKIAALEKRHGLGVVAQYDPDKKAPSISSGSVVMDAATGIGGFPLQGMTEIAGKFSSGKTTVALESGREIQEREPNEGGNVVAFLDFEHALDMSYVKKLGLNTVPYNQGGKWLLCQPNCAEEGIDISQTLIEDDDIGMIICDSVASMIPKKKLEDPANAEIGLNSRVLGPWFPHMAQKCSEYSTPLILLNQVRTKLEGSGRYMKASEDTPGGNSLKFYTLIRIWLTVCGHLKGKVRHPITREWEDRNTANKVRLNVIKNKVAPPFRQIEFFIRYGEGIDNIHTIIEMCKGRGIVKTARGGSFSYTGPSEFKCKGAEKFRKTIDDNPKILHEMIEVLDLDNLWEEKDD